MEWLGWLKESAIGDWVRDSTWGYPIVLTSHALGMALVVGTVLMFDIRVLGYGRRLPVKWLEQFFVIGWIGFALNFVSGVALFTADPVKFLGSTAFLIKMGLIVAGGVSVWLLTRRLDLDGDAFPDRDFVSAKAKLYAGLSFTFWIGAIVAGRLIAYTTKLS